MAEPDGGKFALRHADRQRAGLRAEIADGARGAGRRGAREIPKALSGAARRGADSRGVHHHSDGFDFDRAGYYQSA